jgi:thiol-disulfide isomerase/thioredoxin
MTNKQISALVLAGAVAGILGVATGYYAKRHVAAQDREERAAAIVRPETLPDFTLYDINGEPVTKDALLAGGKALFINFWATWCAPCREEMPLLAKMQEQYADDLVMVGVAIDNREAVAKFLEHLGGVNYSIVLGKQELDAIEIANDMGVDLVGLPISLTADRTGRIIAIHTGEVDEAEATALIEAAIR